MKQKYVIAEVRLFSGNEISVIEIGREEQAISTFMCFTNDNEN